MQTGNLLQQGAAQNRLYDYISKFNGVGIRMNTTQNDVYLEQLIRENEEEVDLIHLGRPYLKWRFSVATRQRPSLQEERLLRQVGDGGRCEIFAGRFDLSECSPEEREAIEKLELGQQTYLSYSPAARGVIGG